MMSSWNQFCFMSGYRGCCYDAWPEWRRWSVACYSVSGQPREGRLWRQLGGNGAFMIVCGGTPLTNVRQYLYSGRISTILVMLGPSQTKPGKGFRTFRSILMTSIISDLSCLPGQSLSRYTCPGGEHPGPMHSDGRFVGRSAPEIGVRSHDTVATRCRFAVRSVGAVQCEL